MSIWRRFTTAAGADDLEDLRRALSADKLSLLAHSYGTALALDAVRRHGEHLEGIVLAGVEGPDRALQFPLVFDFALRRLSTLAAISPNSRGAYPDTYREFQRVLNQVDREPLAVHIRSGPAKQDIDFKVGAFFLQFAVKDMLPNGRKADRIPALVYSLAHGDTSLVTDIVQELYNGLTSGFTAMQFRVLCSDGWSGARRQLAREQASYSVFGDAPLSISTVTFAVRLAPPALAAILFFRFGVPYPLCSSAGPWTVIHQASRRKRSSGVSPMADPFWWKTVSTKHCLLRMCKRW